MNENLLEKYVRVASDERPLIHVFLYVHRCGMVRLECIHVSTCDMCMVSGQTFSLNEECDTVEVLNNDVPLDDTLFLPTKLGLE